MNVIFTSNAKRDLRSIGQHISKADTLVAQRVIQRILDACRLFENYPSLGRVGRIEDTREFSVPNTSCIIAYRIKADIIEIIAVLHSARHWPDTL